MAITVECECGKSFKVKDEYAGKRGKCPACGKVVTVPTPAPEFEEFPDIDALGDIEQTGTVDTSSAGPPPLVARPAAESPKSGQRPCPSCGANISAKALRCEFCGASFHPGAASGGPSPLAYAAPTPKNMGNDEMGVADWLLCIICPGIGLIIGIVRMVQGKSTGIKMLVISGIVIAISTAIRLGLIFGTQH